MNQRRTMMSEKWMLVVLRTTHQRYRTVERSTNEFAAGFLNKPIFDRMRGASSNFSDVPNIRCSKDVFKRTHCISKKPSKYFLLCWCSCATGEKYWTAAGTLIVPQYHCTALPSLCVCLLSAVHCIIAHSLFSPPFFASFRSKISFHFSLYSSIFWDGTRNGTVGTEDGTLLQNGINSEELNIQNFIWHRCGGAKIQHIYPAPFTSIFHKPSNLTL